MAMADVGGFDGDLQLRVAAGSLLPQGHSKTLNRSEGDDKPSYLLRAVPCRPARDWGSEVIGVVIRGGGVDLATFPVMHWTSRWKDLARV
ncbi:hypothetical protein ACFWIA_32965 [Streptomyces sp. NPDC127068]|uniref:hypothetical protein n=1 Tax=Streptomyces sp. NPDC127068 TaxID=3347127 RepID=UPI0036478E65